VRHQQRFAIVITQEGARKGWLEMDWLEKDYRVDESDEIVLSPDDWRAVARGDASILNALQRRILIGHYITDPELIAVIGHPLPGGDSSDADPDAMRHDVARIVRRIRSLHLPPVVMGFWTDEDGWLMDVVESDHVPAVIAGAHREGELAV
jgi:hypothetical protein